MRTDPVLDKCFYITGWLLLLLAAGILAAWHFGLLPAGLQTCLIHRATGFYCPGCGGTRAVYALLHGHVLKSVFYHPLVVYTAVVGGWFMLTQTAAILTRRKYFAGMHYRDVYLWIALALVLVNCAVKNLVLGIGGIALMG